MHNISNRRLQGNLLHLSAALQNTKSQQFNKMFKERASHPDPIEANDVTQFCFYLYIYKISLARDYQYKELWNIWIRLRLTEQKQVIILFINLHFLEQ